MLNKLIPFFTRSPSNWRSNLFLKLCNYSVCRASTIFALSSGYGKCGVAVIRVSGPEAVQAAIQIAGLKVPVKPRFAFLRSLRNPITNEILDRGLVIWFPAPNSFTGEDVLEFQVHGGLAVITAILNSLANIPGYKPAEAGEFTKRAFHAGKLDLTEVEGLADLIHAETEAQRKQALLQMEGTLSSLYDSWKKDCSRFHNRILIPCVAHVEAYIDFSEDENIESDVLQVVDMELKNITKELQNHLKDGRRGEILRDGVRTVIAGEPNVGKSSLLNALCQRPAAIVTPIAGTTRDIVELHANIGGYPVLLADTAGLHDTSDTIEKEGISRAHSYVSQADLILLVVDATKFETWSRETRSFDFTNFLSEYITSLRLSNILAVTVVKNKNNVVKVETNSETKCVVVINKTDLVQNCFEDIVLNNWSNVVFISCKTENGFPKFLDKLKENLIMLCGNPTRENPCLTQSRHRHHLNDCLASLHEYYKYSSVNEDLTLAAQQLRKVYVIWAE